MARFAVEQNGERHAVTSFELLFDLVYVFGFTQVTGWIAHEHDVLGTAQGLVMLGILWWTWCAYSWLGNHMRADRGAPLAAMVVAMVAVFVVALGVRDLWASDAGAWALWVVLAAYALIRAVHLAVYWVGAEGDGGLRRQIAITAAPVAVSLTLLALGAAADPGPRLAWWTAALALDVAGTWTLARRLGGWRVRSPHHFAERFGLVVIMALGESVVAIGVGAASSELTGAVVGLAVVGIGFAVTLWWAYFRRGAVALAERLVAGDAAARTRLATDAYTYLHFPLVAGIVLGAAGVELLVAGEVAHEAVPAGVPLLAAGAACAAGAASGLLALGRGRWWPLAASAVALVAGAALLRDADVWLVLPAGLVVLLLGTAASRTTAAAGRAGAVDVGHVA